MGEDCKKEEEQPIDTSTTKIPPSFSTPFQIIKRRDYMDSIAKKSTQLYLLMQSAGTEIIRQEIMENKRFSVKGDESWDGFEYIYILKGELLYLENENILQEGDSIITQSLKRDYFFKTLTPVSLLYITNGSVFESQCEAMASLMALSKEVQEKDAYTENHCERLQEMAMHIGEELGLEEESFYPLIYGAYLHDIGKINVPEYILTKSGALSKEEWKIMKRHPSWGRHLILEKMKGFYVERASQIIYQHHERYDGRGYPEGLKGDEILQEAQIVSVADTFDAIISDRPYKEGLSIDTAIEEIKRGSGGQFHPEVVEAFLKIIERYPFS